MIPVRQYRQMVTTMQNFGPAKRSRRAVRKAALSAFNQSNLVPGLISQMGPLIAQSLSK
jgi:hypothetical protein